MLFNEPSNAPALQRSGVLTGPSFQVATLRLEMQGLNTGMDRLTSLLSKADIKNDDSATRQKPSIVMPEGGPEALSSHKTTSKVVEKNLKFKSILMLLDKVFFLLQSISIRALMHTNAIPGVVDFESLFHTLGHWVVCHSKGLLLICKVAYRLFLSSCSLPD